MILLSPFTLIGEKTMGYTKIFYWSKPRMTCLIHCNKKYASKITEKSEIWQLNNDTDVSNH